MWILIKEENGVFIEGTTTSRKIRSYIGESTSTKPVLSEIYTGSECWEVDTSTFYILYNGEWIMQ